MESAVISVPTACTLVKAIALGQRLPREGMYHVQFKLLLEIKIKKTHSTYLLNLIFFFTVQNERNTLRTNQLTNDLPHLNQSQRQAVIKALNENFTLVWGPPGNYYSARLPFGKKNKTKNK